MASTYKELKARGCQPVLLNGPTREAIKLVQEKLAELEGQKVTQQAVVMIALYELLDRLNKKQKLAIPFEAMEPKS